MTRPERRNDIGGNDEIHGEDGNDFIHGMTGDDILFGEAGDDVIIGGWGNDWISGGTGIDGILGDDGWMAISVNSTVGRTPLRCGRVCPAVSLTRPFPCRGNDF
jgi:hypothetical protein